MGVREPSKGETLEEIKRVIFEVKLSPEEIERMNAIQEAIREGDRLNRTPGQRNPEQGRERY